jgi:glutathione S-transferase
VRVWRIPFSTNVERVALAAGHKGLPIEWMDVDPDDRSPVERLSGQRLVPVLEDDDGMVVADSAAILEHLERRFPQRPLFPPDPLGAQVRVFVDWFNRVWKAAPNAIEAELGRDEPGQERIGELSASMTGALDLFEGLLAGGDFLFGESFTAADCAAFPFLKYAALGRPPGDEELFHRILVDHQPLGLEHPRLEAWIHRVDGLPRA